MWNLSRRRGFHISMHFFANETMKTGKKKSNVDQQIDENLRRVYNDALNENVPDRFTDLIRQLKESESESDTTYRNKLRKGRQ